MKRINVYTVELVKEKGGLYDIEDTTIRSPRDAYELVEKVLSLSTKTKEHFAIVTLNTKNKVMGVHVIHVGSLNASLVSPREIFQQAILNNAMSIIAFHNHPSGDVTPSPEDIEVTERLMKCGKLLGIDVLDHVIIGDNKMLSLKEKGYMQDTRS